uniref:Uncharacterized protein n=1 Tax=Vespula pensylvanica TaxID=30213 RepID=A0A834NYT8_VESPE|nr:hypothetical protein H0235_009558 [Vespula pensylvanica]
MHKDKEENSHHDSHYRARELAALAAYDHHHLDGEMFLQALNGFLLILTCDGEVFFATHSIESYLGFHQRRGSFDEDEDGGASGGGGGGDGGGWWWWEERRVQAVEKGNRARRGEVRRGVPWLTKSLIEKPVAKVQLGEVDQAREARF